MIIDFVRILNIVPLNKWIIFSKTLYPRTLYPNKLFYFQDNIKLNILSIFVTPKTESHHFPQRYFLDPQRLPNYSSSLLKFNQEDHFPHKLPNNRDCSITNFNNGLKTSKRLSNRITVTSSLHQG